MRWSAMLDRRRGIADSPAMRYLHTLSAAALALTASPTLAEDAMCRNGLFPSEPPFMLAEVTAPGRAHFYDDLDGCPEKGEACRGKAYVVKGDKLLVNRMHGEFVCAFYPGKGGGTAGWVESARLGFAAYDAHPPRAAWIGQWSPGDNPSIRFYEDGGALHVVGEAFWPGRPGTHDWISTHVGEIDAKIGEDLSGNRLHYEDENLCEIDFTLVGDWLVAADNRQCGGANVSFSGVYRRMSK
jgi:hypothetical protein